MRRDVFQAIADPVRRDIIKLLAKQTLTVNTVAEQFEVSRPAISKHLKILKECGIIIINKEGRERLCQIQPKNLIPAFLWIEQYRDLWEEKLDSFENYLVELQTNNKKMSRINEANNRTLTLERTFNAPVTLVWEAWTQPEHIALWWGPKGMKTKVIEHDFRVGGQWKYMMVMPNRNEFISDGIYLEIVELKKIVSSANFKPMTEGVEIQALFEKNGDKTNFTFNVVHPTEEYCKQQEKMGFYNGWVSVFDRLNEYLQKKIV